MICANYIKIKKLGINWTKAQLQLCNSQSNNKKTSLALNNFFDTQLKTTQVDTHARLSAECSIEEPERDKTRWSDQCKIQLCIYWLLTSFVPHTEHVRHSSSDKISAKLNLSLNYPTILFAVREPYIAAH